jgi:hypothetical protein
MRNFAFACAAAAVLIGGPTIAMGGQAGHAPVAVNPITLAQVSIEVGKDRDRHRRWESRKRDRHSRRESRRRKDHD